MLNLDCTSSYTSIKKTVVLNAVIVILLVVKQDLLILSQKSYIFNIITLVGKTSITGRSFCLCGTSNRLEHL